MEERERLESVCQSWPQLVPQSLKNKILRLFHNETSSEALSTFTCAACAESMPLHSHCSVNVGDQISNIELDVLKQEVSDSKVPDTDMPKSGTREMGEAYVITFTEERLFRRASDQVQNFVTSSCFPAEAC
jgi:hypothetical protein